MTEYFIENGVHRAVAARENGLKSMVAVLYEHGTAPRRITVALDQLHSPKPSISRSDMRHNYPALEAAMATAAVRLRIPPIEVQPLGTPGQPLSIPLALVRITS